MIRKNQYGASGHRSGNLPSYVRVLNGLRYSVEKMHSIRHPGENVEMILFTNFILHSKYWFAVERCASKRTVSSVNLVPRCSNSVQSGNALGLSGSSTLADHQRCHQSIHYHLDCNCRPIIYVLPSARPTCWVLWQRVTATLTFTLNAKIHIDHSTEGFRSQSQNRRRTFARQCMFRNMGFGQR